MNAAIPRPVKSPPAGTVRPGAVTAVDCLALAAVVAALSSLNVALPGIARATHASQTQLAWIIDAYSLVFASLLLPAGAIGDRYGRRLALITGLSIFGAGSAVAMTAQSANELIGLRAVIGLGAALVMPATLSTITGTFASEQRTRAVSVWAAVAGGAAVLGLLVSGIVLQVWSWPSAFGLNVVLAAAAIAGTLRFVPESADPAAPRLDIGGAILAVLGLVALVYSIIEAAAQGWLSAHAGRPGHRRRDPRWLRLLGTAPPPADDRSPGLHPPRPGRRPGQVPGHLRGERSGGVRSPAAGVDAVGDVPPQPAVVA
jgi:MFS family permease